MFEFCLQLFIYKSYNYLELIALTSLRLA